VTICLKHARVAEIIVLAYETFYTRNLSNGKATALH